MFKNIIIIALVYFLVPTGCSFRNFPTNEEIMQALSDFKTWINEDTTAREKFDQFGDWLFQKVDRANYTNSENYFLDKLYRDYRYVDPDVIITPLSLADLYDRQYVADIIGIKLYSGRRSGLDLEDLFLEVAEAVTPKVTLEMLASDVKEVVEEKLISSTLPTVDSSILDSFSLSSLSSLTETVTTSISNSVQNVSYSVINGSAELGRDLMSSLLKSVLR